MWHRFTESAKLAIYRSEEAATQFNSTTISTGHLLHGLLHEEKFITSPGRLQVFVRSETFDQDCLAIRILTDLRVNIRSLKDSLESKLPIGAEEIDQEIILSQKGKLVIDLAYDESRSLFNDFIGTEHLFLALIREHDGLAAQILKEAGITIELARALVKTLQDSHQ